MTAEQAKRIAHLLRDMAQNLRTTAVGTARLRAECRELAQMLDEHAEWKQIAEAPPREAFDATADVSDVTFGSCDNLPLTFLNGRRIRGPGGKI